MDRMLRFLATCVLTLACLAPVSALDTPMVLQLGSRTVVVNAGVGTLIPYEATRSGLVQQGAPYRFLNDLEFLSRLPIEMPGVSSDNDPWCALRRGSDSKTSSIFILGQLPQKPNARQAAAGKPSDYAAARMAERAYWKKDRSYDGKVAIATSGTYLLVAVPSYNSILLYQFQSDKFELKAYRALGADFYIPSVFKSTPLPSAMLDNLKPDERKQALEQLGLVEGAEDLKDAKPDAGKAEPAAAEPAAEAAPTPDMDLWAVGAGKELFVLVDAANERAYAYQMSGATLELKSVRNLKTDLAIPGIRGKGLGTTPDEDDLLKAYKNLNKRDIEASGFEVDLPGLRALVAQAKPASKEGKDGKLQAKYDGGLLTLDFTERRVVLCLDASNDQLNLTSARDYTVDLGMAIMSREFENLRNAPRVLKQASDLARAERLDQSKSMLTWALDLNPGLVKAAEDDRELKRAFAKTPDWTAILDHARKLAEDRKKAAEERKKAAEEERKRRAGGR